ncbi:MAG: HAD hydrolase family protein [Rhodothermia bacterium]|nr:MAG: HAD hydrolase family protein [Rhodothermia bacterium]
MIRLFISDIDGCLATPYQPFLLDELAELRLLAEQAGLPGTNGFFPSFSICSGRPYPYVEAMSQVLGLATPVLFESGAGMFDPVAAQRVWHTDVNRAMLDDISHVKSFLNQLVKNTVLMVDLAKQTQASVVAPGPEPIQAVFPEIQTYVSDNHPELEIFRTFFSVDVVVPNLTKQAGVQWLASLFELEMSEVAFIGDTDGDLGALQVVGRSYAPSNATKRVQDSVDVSTIGRDVAGVVEAFRDAIHFNEQTKRE